MAIAANEQCDVEKSATIMIYFLLSKVETKTSYGILNLPSPPSN